MPTTLQKITTRAKQLKKKHPATKWANLVKMASKEYRTGKLGATKTTVSKKLKKKFTQTGSSSKLHDERTRAKKPGWRKSSSGRLYFENRKNRSDTPGTMTGIDKSKMISSLNELVRELSSTDIKATHLKFALKDKMKRKEWPLLRKNLAYQEKKAKVLRENISNLKRLI